MNEISYDKNIVFNEKGSINITNLTENNKINENYHFNNVEIENSDLKRKVNNIDKTYDLKSIINI